MVIIKLILVVVVIVVSMVKNFDSIGSNSNRYDTKVLLYHVVRKKKITSHTEFTAYGL